MTTLRERMSDGDEGFLFAEGFDDGILGVCQSVGNPDVVAYDVDKCTEILMDNNGWDWDEANEYFYNNVVGAYMGEKTPVFVVCFIPAPVLTGS